MTALDRARTPVIAAVGQVTERSGSATALDLAERAAAPAEAPRLASRIELVSVPAILSPSSSSPGSALARRLQLSPSRCETSTTGGNTPQWLTTRAAARIATGKLEATLIVGAEVLTSALAGHGGLSEESERSEPVVGDPRPGTSADEDGAGLTIPVRMYAMFESVLAARAGHSHEAHRAELGRMLAPFTETAASNEHARFAQTLGPDEISTPTEGNRVVAEPYTSTNSTTPAR